MSKDTVNISAHRFTNGKLNLRRYHQAKWDEPVIFELGQRGQRAILVPEVEEEIRDQVGDVLAALPESLRRRQPPGLPELGQPQVLRHYVRLSQENLGADLNIDVGQGKHQGHRHHVPIVLPAHHHLCAGPGGHISIPGGVHDHIRPILPRPILTGHHDACKRIALHQHIRHRTVQTMVAANLRQEFKRRQLQILGLDVQTIAIDVVVRIAIGVQRRGLG